MFDGAEQGRALCLGGMVASQKPALLTVFPLFQGKLQKHQAFEAEVQANSGAIVKLDETGNLMMNEGHFSCETIRVSLESSDSLQSLFSI